EMLKGLVDEMNRRQELIETLPNDRCPNSKVTPALCRDRRLDMGLIVCAIDEVQRLLECETPAWDEDDVPSGRGRPKKIPTDAEDELSDSDAQIVRTHFMDLPTLQAICDRGRELRIQAGTLTGEAAGEDLVVETPARPFLEDVRAVFGIGESKLWSETIASRL